MFIFRTLTLWIFGLPVTAVFFLLVLISLPFSKDGSAIHSIGSLWCRIILLISGVKVAVDGVSNIPTDGPIILASNHQGVYDIPVLLGKLPLQFRWVAKESLFKIPVIGWTMGFAGYISINRESASKSFKSILKAAQKIKNGTSVVIFPEGTRSKEDEILPFKRGTFFLALKSGVPVVPVSISGTRGIMQDYGIFIHPAKVRVSIGEPIATEGRTEPEIMEAARAAIEKGVRWGE